MSGCLLTAIPERLILFGKVGEVIGSEIFFSVTFNSSALPLCTDVGIKFLILAVGVSGARVMGAGFGVTGCGAAGGIGDIILGAVGTGASIGPPVGGVNSFVFSIGFCGMIFCGGAGAGGIGTDAAGAAGVGAGGLGVSGVFDAGTVGVSGRRGRISSWWIEASPISI